MIEKLSDENIKNIANDFCIMSPRGDAELIIWAMEKARDYYDTQIDAQAKTMDDLLYAFFSSKIEKSVIDWCKKRDLHMSEIVRVHFSMYVSFFLAAGGRIKE